MTLTAPAPAPTAPSAGTGRAISVRGAVRRYGAVTALDAVDLDIRPGEFTVLLGPSGSGKSTLARCIAGIERLDGGELRLDGALVSSARTHVAPERRELGMVFQDYALWPHLTIGENVAFALRRRKLGRDVARSRSAEMLERVGLGGMDRRYPHELSGGQQQRVALARAIVARPSVIVFDEPLSNLDADLRERLRIQISTLVRETGSTAVYITHDQSEAFALADRIAVLRAGRIEQFDEPEAVHHHPATRFVAEFTGIGGMLSGRVVGRTPKGVTVAVAGRELCLTARAGTPDAGAVDVLLRPSVTRLAAEDAASVPGGLFAVPGVVRDVAYRGRSYDHVVDTEYGLISGVVESRAVPRGNRCAVLIDPDGCLVFPTATATAA
ncbi:ABC transporter ATP-binding protein [Microbacterium sp. CJ88]|uniref:ABC transporter ATP-binding protein n=1 Tax=Microbacterium sp. CJ88 TaxID=3445672 RepID=UPI003F65C27A